MPSANQDYFNMVSLNPNQHKSQKFDEEMENLRNYVLEMCGFVEQQIGRASSALRMLDTSEAEAVVRNDEHTNALLRYPLMKNVPVPGSTPTGLIGPQNGSGCDQDRY